MKKVLFLSLVTAVLFSGTTVMATDHDTGPPIAKAELKYEKTTLEVDFTATSLYYPLPTDKVDTEITLAAPAGKALFVALVPRYQVKVHAQRQRTRLCNWKEPTKDAAANKTVLKREVPNKVKRE
jgi:hypothetical protein